MMMGINLDGARHTELALEYFFSVVIWAPDLWAALNALFPRMTVSRSEAPGPRTRLPILVVESQSRLDMMMDLF